MPSSGPKITHDANGNEWTEVYSQTSIGLDRFIRVLNLNGPGWEWETWEWPGGYVRIGPFKLIPVPWPTKRSGIAENPEEIFRLGIVAVRATIKVRPASTTQFLIRACTNFIYVSDCTSLGPTP